jgi:hypothetical protein
MFGARRRLGKPAPPRAGFARRESRGRHDRLAWTMAWATRRA